MRSDLINAVKQIFQLKELDPRDLVLFNENNFHCTCNSPSWAIPYTKHRISVPFEFHNYCLNFYTDLESDLSQSEKDYMYVWIYQLGPTSNLALLPLLSFLSDWYKKDPNPPEVISVVSEDVVCSSNTLKFDKLDPEYVYYTKDVIELKRSGLSGNRQGIRKYSKERFTTVSVKDYCKTIKGNSINKIFSLSFLHKFLQDWYQTKKDRLDHYPFFEVNHTLIDSVYDLLENSSLDFNGVLVFDNENRQLIAFSFASKLRNDYWSCLVRFANESYASLSHYLFNETAKLYQNYMYCNDGGSSGLPGLANFKSLLMAEDIKSPVFYSVLPIDIQTNTKELL